MSGTKFPDLFRLLTWPFPKDQVKILRKANREFRYLTSRSLMNRLDEVLGPENWTATYKNSQSSTECSLSITLPDGTIVAKTDVGGSANMSDEGDDEKSSYTDAFKRACMCWGIGRELWGDGNVFYGPVEDPPKQPVVLAAHPTPKKKLPIPKPEPIEFHRDGTRSTPIGSEELASTQDRDDFARYFSGLRLLRPGRALNFVLGELFVTGRLAERDRRDAREQLIAGSLQLAENYVAIAWCNWKDEIEGLLGAALSKELESLSKQGG